jgi:hypothetical protein
MKNFIKMKGIKYSSMKRQRKRNDAAIKYRFRWKKGE